MSKIEIKFSKHKPVIIEVMENETSRLFNQVLQRNIVNNDQVWRDPLKYTKEYFQTLCKDVAVQLGWNWIKDEYSIEQTTKMHKKIEQTLEKSESFRTIPGHLQNLIHEAHFCIHQMQYSKQDRSPFIQIEWFNDDYEPIPEDAVFTTDVGFGDVILQNPYVGHPPIQCYQQNDFSDIARTCQFHDIIKPGVKIQTNEKNNKDTWDYDQYRSWWMTNCQDYVEKVGWETIDHYTGWPKIGKVLDLDNLLNIKYEKEITLIGLEVYDKIPTKM